MSKVDRSSSDGKNHSAKPARHNSTNPEYRRSYEHPDITDNRLVWEALEITDAKTQEDSSE